jgi:hypothetical protein
VYWPGRNRFLELPGFANRKLTGEFIVQARHESKAIHAPHDFAIEEGSPEAQRHLGEDHPRRRSMQTDHKSQSEQDWAYAKRALARGDDPDLVIKRIAGDESTSSERTGTTKHRPIEASRFGTG